MQIELSDTMWNILAIALAWYLVCSGSGHVVGNWFYWRENCRRDREARRREGNTWNTSLQMSRRATVSVDKDYKPQEKKS